MSKSTLQDKIEGQVKKSKINNGGVKMEGVITLKVEPDLKDKLSKHFRMRRGLSLSAGVRELLLDYINEKNLL